MLSLELVTIRVLVLVIVAHAILEATRAPIVQTRPGDDNPSDDVIAFIRRAGVVARIDHLIQAHPHDARVCI